MYERTLQFSVRVIAMIEAMPKSPSAHSIALQLSRSATSIGANYREACHAKSFNDFAYKLKICEGEADETLYWLQVIVRSGLMKPSKMQALIDEANALVAIFTAACKTAYQKRK